MRIFWHLAVNNYYLKLGMTPNTSAIQSFYILNTDLFTNIFILGHQFVCVRFLQSWARDYLFASRQPRAQLWFCVQAHFRQLSAACSPLPRPLRILFAAAIDLQKQILGWATSWNLNKKWHVHCPMKNLPRDRALPLEELTLLNQGVWMSSSNMEREAQLAALLIAVSR